MNPTFRLLSVLAALSLASLLFALKTGSFAISWGDLWHVFTGQAQGHLSLIINELRLPRALAAFTTGGLLALAGALMQVLLRNPLADPYILGISGGSAVGALSAMLLGLGGAAMSGSAFGGALLSLLLVFVIARGAGSWATHRLLLTGVVIGSGWAAIISFLLAISAAQQLRPMLFWLMGDLSEASFSGWAMLALISGLLLALAVARSLNLLARGEQQAALLGVNIVPLRWLLYFLAALLTTSAVTMAGSVGFVGLIIPHALRLLGVRDHRVLLPAAVLLGGSVLVLADTLARTVLAPQQLPVGVLMAFIGVPTFLWLLHRGRA